jgi:prevent-host-death family protein
MAKEISLTNLRKELFTVVKELADDPTVSEVVATRNGKPAAVLLNYDLYEGLLETVELMSDPELAESVRSGLADIRAGRVKSLEEVKTELGL